LMGDLIDLEINYDKVVIILNIYCLNSGFYRATNISMRVSLKVICQFRIFKVIRPSLAHEMFQVSIKIIVQYENILLLNKIYGTIHNNTGGV
jgi:hypothetical protein